MICELYPNFPYIMEEATYRTLIITITGIVVGIFSPLTVYLLIRYFKYRKQEDYNKKIEHERLRIQVESIAAGIKGSKNIQTNGDFRAAYDEYKEKAESESLILNPIQVPNN